MPHPILTLATAYPAPLIPMPLLVTATDVANHCDGCGLADPAVDDYNVTRCCEGRLCPYPDCQHRATCRTCDAPAVEFVPGTGWVCANTGH